MELEVKHWQLGYTWGKEILPGQNRERIHLWAVWVVVSWWLCKIVCNHNAYDVRSFGYGFRLSNLDAPIIDTISDRRFASRPQIVGRIAVPRNLTMVREEIVLLRRWWVAPSDLSIHACEPRHLSTEST